MECNPKQSSQNGNEFTIDDSDDSEVLTSDLELNLCGISCCSDRWEFINPFSRSTMKTDNSYSTEMSRKEKNLNDLIQSPLTSPKDIQNFLSQIINNKDEVQAFMNELKKYGASRLSQMHNLGDILYAQSKLKEAKVCYLQAINDYSKESHKENISNLNLSLGDIFDMTGEILKAFEHYHVALEYTICLYGNKSLEVATIYDKIGSLYNQTGQFEESIKFFTESLVIKSKVYKQYNKEILDTELNISVSLCNWGKYIEALDILGKALKKVSFELPDFIELKIGYIFQKNFKFKEAKLHFENAFDLYAKKNSKRVEFEHKIFNSLANYYIDVGFTLKASQLCQKTESISKDKSFNIEFLKTMLIIGKEKLAIGNYDEAYQFMINAQESAKNHSGKRGLMYSLALSGSAYALLGQKNLTKAKKTFQEALQIKEGLLCQVDIDRLSDQLNIALIDAMLGDIDGAQLMYNECLNQCLSTIGEQAYETAYCYAGLGDLCYMNKNYNGALRYYQNAREIFDSLELLYLPFARTLLQKLGNCLIVLTRYDDAKDNIIKSLDSSEKLKERNQIRWASGFFSMGMIQFYKKNYSEAVKCFEFSQLTLCKYDESHPANDVIKLFLDQAVNLNWNSQADPQTKTHITDSKKRFSRSQSTKCLEGFYLICESWLYLPDED